VMSVRSVNMCEQALESNPISFEFKLLISLF
jgi:hypothetical protein